MDSGFGGRGGTGRHIADWMEGSEMKNPAEPGRSVPGRDTRDGGTQTDSRIPGEPEGGIVHGRIV